MSESAQRSRLKTLICLGLGLTTLLLYLPSLRQGFLPYDDQQYVTENLQVQAGLTWQGLTWAFGYHAGNWHPLTWLSHMLDCQLYGLKPAGHHLTNVLLHVTNTLLLFMLLNQMTGTLWRSACVAALFAWHPLHVESVAWVAERKDVLSACFWMLTLLAYVNYAAKAVLSRYVLTLLAFILALMSKPMAVTLPFVLLLLDFWPLRRFSESGTTSAFQPAGWRRLLIEKVPFFALTIASCALTIAAQAQAIVSTGGLPIIERLKHALVAYAHYLKVTFIPRGLAIYYPYEIEIPLGQIVLAGILMVSITVLVCWFASSRRYLPTGWFWFLGTLVPVIGLVQVGDQAWADRYTYLPLIGVFILVVWGIADAVKKPRMLWGAAGIAVTALLILTTLQLQHWRNTQSLFAHAARVVPNNYMAITMLGSLLAKDGKSDEAIEQYKHALQLKPQYAEAYFFLGNALDQQGKLDAAIAAYRQALRFRPIQEQTHILLGVALTKQGKFGEARAHYQAALKLNPASAVTHNNLARVLQTTGQFDEAIHHFSMSLRIDPGLAQAHNNLGVLLIQQGKSAQGTTHLRESLRLNSTNRETQYNLALALNESGNWGEAVQLFAQTVGNSPASPNAHYQFAVALVKLGRTREAMGQYASTLLSDPDHVGALNGLAWILSTAPEPEFRNGVEAIRMAERASELTKRANPENQMTLAAAQGEMGRFPEAITTVEKALELASKAGNPELAGVAQSMLASFKKSEPWRASQTAP